MKKPGLKCIVLVLVLGVWASEIWGEELACQQEINATEKSLRVVESKVASLGDLNRSRAEKFLSDAKRLIADARKICTEEHKTLERIQASGMVLVAQGNISAAGLLLKVD